MTGVTPADLLLYAAAVAVPVFLVSLVIAVRGHRRTGLRERFGAEYDRTLAVRGSTRRAIRDLEEREHLADELTLEPLPGHLQPAFAARAASAQWALGDDTARALAEVSSLTLDALRARLYPSDEELTLRLVSVASPRAAVALHRGIEGSEERPPQDDPGVDLAAFRSIADLLRRHVGLTWSAADLLRSPLPPTNAPSTKRGQAEGRRPGADAQARTPSSEASTDPRPDARPPSDAPPPSPSAASTPAGPERGADAGADVHAGEAAPLPAGAGQGAGGAPTDAAPGATRATRPSQDAKPQDAKPQDAEPRDSRPQNAKPQDAKPEDAKPEDEDAKPGAPPGPTSAPPGSAGPGRPRRDVERADVDRLR